MKKHSSIDQLIRDLNDNSITSQKKADILIEIIDLESQSDDADMELIEECFDYLEFLTNSEAEIETRKGQLPDRLQRTYQKAADMENDSEDQLVPKIQPVARKRRFRKAGIAAAIIAATLLISMTTLTVIARVNGYNDPWEWLSKHWEEYLQLDNGGQLTGDGITVIRQTETIVYPDMESWLKEENLNLLYPSDLPEGIRLDHINQSARGEGEVDIYFVFSTPEVSFHAKNHDLDQYEIHEEDMEIIEINEYCFSILYTPEIEFAYHAYCIVDNFAYGIGCQDRDTLLILINHLKGIKS